MAQLKNKILVPVDFSEQSKIALAQSVGLARIARADIVLFHVIDEDHLGMMKLFMSSKKENDGKYEIKVKKQLDDLATSSSGKSGVKITTMISQGKIYEEIDKAAIKLKCSFIVMATNGTSSLKKRFIGSNALRVIRQSPCPVISIRGKKHSLGCKNILLPLDLSRETREKVTKAIELANYYGSTIHILSVLTDDDEFHVNKMKRTMSQVQHFIEEKNIRVTTEAVFSRDIAEEVISYGKKINADLIMIMTQEEMNWTDFFIGSAAQEIINDSDIPVLSIRPLKKKSLAEYPV